MRELAAAGRSSAAKPVMSHEAVELQEYERGASGGPGFRHEALLYAGLEELVRRTLPFIAEGREAGEAVLVILCGQKVAALREALRTTDGVHFADMAEVGANPARIIPCWRAFVREHAAAGRGARGIGEPIYAERSAAELAECQLHERLVNVAFARAGGFRLLCPYDTDVLPAAVIDEALRSHPYTVADGRPRRSDAYGEASWRELFAAPLPEPPPGAALLWFEDSAGLRRLRAFVADEARRFGLGRSRSADLVLAVHEAAANSLRHAGGAPALRVWAEEDALVCEIEDRGRMELKPLIGRVEPAPDARASRGLWLIQQLADLAQVRRAPTALACGSACGAERPSGRMLAALAAVQACTICDGRRHVGRRAVFHCDRGGERYASRLRAFEGLGALLRYAPASAASSPPRRRAAVGERPARRPGRRSQGACGSSGST